jgi:formate dehydrogenase alpha subunit
MTNSIREIEDMEVIFIIGSNTKETHPVIANKMIKAYRKGAKIIVADPRKVPMARFAELFLNLKPGTDVALLNGLANVIIREGLYDKKFIDGRTEGFEEWKGSVKDFTPEYVEKVTGITKDNIINAARLFGSSRKAGIFYTMGITQHSCGTDNVNAIANLALLTGNIGREFSGINPLRGQNNVQGASDAGCLPNVYPGYQRVDLPEIRHKFEKAWGVSLSPDIGLKSTEMVPAALEGKLKAMYIMGENPVITDPNINHTIKALRNLEFLVVQDIFLTETAELADVVLPSACFAEKDGTFTNTERMVQRVRKAIAPPGEARDDLSIIIDISKRVGYHMEYNSPEEVFEEFGQLWTALAGITYSRIKKHGIQWPCTTKDHPGTEYLYKGGFPRGRVHFTPTLYNPPVETTDNEYPFVLTTGRNLFQYHAGSMTRRVEPIERHAGEPYVEINPLDGERLDIRDGDIVKIISRRGKIEIKARITMKISDGVIFIPMHYREAAANVLTNDEALDTYVKTPEYKVCAVKIEKIKEEAYD